MDTHTPMPVSSRGNGGRASREGMPRSSRAHPWVLTQVWRQVGDNGATAAAFESMAAATGGEAKKLESADDLLDVVCLQALEQVLPSATTTRRCAALPCQRAVPPPVCCALCAMCVILLHGTCPSLIPAAAACSAP